MEYFLLFFYLHEEGTFDRSLEDNFKHIDGSRMSFLQATDMEDVASISRREKALLKNRLDNGMACWGIRINDKLAAYTWCNFKRCHDNLIPFDLGDDEVYLFDAYTDKSFRGKNLASYLRYNCYLQLERMGYKKFYSITDFFNSPAKKFKQKLHAKPVVFGAYIEIRNKYRKTWIVNSFRPINIKMNHT